MSDVKDIAALRPDKLSGNSVNNKVIYIVIAEDPTSSKKTRAYLAERLDAHPAFAELGGWEANNINLAQCKDAKSVGDALELVKKDADREHLHLPWQRIIRIKVVKFAVNK